MKRYKSAPLRLVLLLAAFATSRQLLGAPEFTAPSLAVQSAGTAARRAVLRAIAPPPGEQIPPGAKGPIVGDPVPIVPLELSDLTGGTPSSNVPGGAKSTPPPGASPPVTSSGLTKLLASRLKAYPTEMYIPAQANSGQTLVLALHLQGTQWLVHGKKDRGEYVSTLGRRIGSSHPSGASSTSTNTGAVPVGVMNVRSLNLSFFVAKSSKGLLLRPVEDQPDIGLMKSKWIPAERVFAILKPMAVQHEAELPKNGERIPPQ